MKPHIYMYKSIILFAAVVSLLCGCGNTQNAAQTPPQKPVSHVEAPAISPQSDQLFQEGLKAYQAFDYDKAIATYDKAIAADANNYKAISGKGVALAMRGNTTGNTNDVTEGIRLIQNALEKAPDYVPSFYDLALAYKIDHQYDESIQWFQKVIDREPDNTWSYYGIATIYGDKGQAKEAVTYLKKAVELDGADVKEAARSQSHFDSIRNDPDFKALIN